MRALFTEKTAVQFMVDWFLGLYEDPAEHTPHDEEGEYVYIWGNPVDEEEELENNFGGVFTPELIAVALKKLRDEHKVFGWVPKPSEELCEDEHADGDEDD